MTQITEESNMQILHNTQYKFRPTKIYSLDVITLWAIEYIPYTFLHIILSKAYTFRHITWLQSYTFRHIKQGIFYTFRHMIKKV